MGMRRQRTKNPPILSQEYFIQNHADIVCCVAMVFILGLIFQVTSPVASLFIAMQHNVTVNGSEDSQANYYTYGPKDAFAVFFYMLICIIVHAIIQEYLLDKFNRKMHLSKVKHSKFNESGQLIIFFGLSAFWGADIIIREAYITNINALWEYYPHAELPFVVKLFFIVQISYWIHCYFELYFQKIKKDEISARVQYISFYLATILIAYVLNFTRVALCIMVLHYTVEFVFHAARLLHFKEKQEIASNVFMVWNVLFVIVRLCIITLAFLTFWYGLRKTSQSSIDFQSGNFNTMLIRIFCLSAICLLQVWMMWNFINFHIVRMRERSALSNKKSPKKKIIKLRDSSSAVNSDTNHSTENGAVRSRGKGKKN
ncbi:chain-associated membrane 1-like 1 [Octopus vulgaris]|uniref:Chain-associated membrane 1-like 1 n=2 Tax=Octopus TaxID=6643 RepID=A0AA36AQR1_OCTVU|nr:translocating chain-associated membrane protein 1-like 1 [Octopus sinensis]CAI9720571.1 chain-associated membrane 1-like 1 [Octopus vulgaris]